MERPRRPSTQEYSSNQSNDSTPDCRGESTTGKENTTNAGTSLYTFLLEFLKRAGVLLCCVAGTHPSVYLSVFPLLLFLFSSLWLITAAGVPVVPLVLPSTHRNIFWLGVSNFNTHCTQIHKCKTCQDWYLFKKSYFKYNIKLFWMDPNMFSSPKFAFSWIQGERVLLKPVLAGEGRMTGCHFISDRDKHPLIFIHTPMDNQKFSINLTCVFRVWE